ncbi:MAG: ATP-binding cassette domain-containing protein, partial [Acidimicrobiia bacterium]|nr:ATP-binding cassette domain-containing protein [Acidimicrobiia bacterium]
MTLIETAGLVAGPKGIPAVRGLDLTVEAGEIVALLGPNGAGKSVTLATLAGVLPVIDGLVEVLGQPVDGHSVHAIARRGLAYLADDRGLFTQLTAAQNLRLYHHRASVVPVERAVGYFPQL